MFAGFGGDYDFNQASIEGFGTLTTNQRKPYFQKFGWSQNFRYYGNDASNNYHAMQLKAEKRFSHGYSLLGHYTFSRSFNYTNTYYNIDPKLAYGPNDNHRPHAFGMKRRVGAAVRARAEISQRRGWGSRRHHRWLAGELRLHLAEWPAVHTHLPRLQRRPR